MSRAKSICDSVTRLGQWSSQMLSIQYQHDSESELELLCKGEMFSLLMCKAGRDITQNTCTEAKSSSIWKKWLRAGCTTWFQVISKKNVKRKRCFFFGPIASKPYKFFDIWSCYKKLKSCKSIFNIHYYSCSFISPSFELYIIFCFPAGTWASLRISILSDI